MNTNTDPARAQDELRMQAALLRTPEFMAQFDPDKFAGQLERIAAAIASAPPSAPEPEVHSYDPTDQRESVTIRWQDGKCLSYVLDRTRYTDNLPPSAPVGVEGQYEEVAPNVAYIRFDNDDAPNWNGKSVTVSLAQQPAGVGGVPQAWISDNDLMKLHESVDEARNIRMSVRRTNTRVHPIYIPALAAIAAANGSS